MNEKNTRLLSLDVFRGITIAAMILVNNPGSWSHIYAPLEHAAWNGCTPTDLIFPFFLFIVGVSITFSLAAKKASADKKSLYRKIVRRALVIYGVGLFMVLVPNIFYEFGEKLRTFRIMGVLQRIALVYGITALLYLRSSRKTLIVLFATFLVVYWGLMTFVPVPGTGYANLEKDTNLGAWLDRLILGVPHLWSGSVTWDPEGLLSSLPALSTCLFGVLVGGLLKSKLDNSSKVSWMFTWGLLAVLAGLVWDRFFPINKALWTSSFVLYTGGLAAMGLGLCYWLIDVHGYKKFTYPFVVFGVNALPVFFFSGMMAKGMNLIKVGSGENTTALKTFLYERYITPNFSPINASLVWAVLFVLFWYGVLWLMYKRNLVIKA